MSCRTINIDTRIICNNTRVQTFGCCIVTRVLARSVLSLYSTVGALLYVYDSLPDPNGAVLGFKNPERMLAYLFSVSHGARRRGHFM